MKNNIVISGIGIVCPLGVGKEKFWKNEFLGKTTFYKEDTMIDLGLKSHIVSKLKDFDEKNHLSSNDYNNLKNSSLPWEMWITEIIFYSKHSI